VFVNPDSLLRKITGYGLDGPGSLSGGVRYLFFSTICLWSCGSSV